MYLYPLSTALRVFPVLSRIEVPLVHVVFQSECPICDSEIDSLPYVCESEEGDRAIIDAEKLVGIAGAYMQRREDVPGAYG